MRSPCIAAALIGAHHADSVGEATAKKSRQLAIILFT
jgi:hypothetical protein